MLKFSTQSRMHFQDYALIQRDEDLFYIVGGRGAWNYGDFSKILKWEAEVWSYVGDLQHARNFPVLAMNGDQLLIMAGWSTTFTNNQAT